MKCQYCDCQDTRVIDSRDTLDSIRRRRQCIACGKRFTTYERAEIPVITVVKRDGRREHFDRDKIEKGIERACEKRPVPREEIVALTDRIEERLRREGVAELQSGRLGELVLEGLKQLDDVAYVRFASVYREFSDTSQFEQEIARLASKKASGAKVSSAPVVTTEQQGGDTR